MTLFTAAFLLGFAGSFHCVGMCGPLAMVLPLNNKTGFSRFVSAMYYNAGRVLTYSVFGFITGLLGKSIAISGYQQWLSIGIGGIILCFIFLQHYFKSGSTNTLLASFFLVIRRAIAQLFTKKNNSSLFAIGVLNGFLPCGLVYMAVAGAVVTADILKSTLFMAFFAVGTLPAMLAVSFFSQYISVRVRQAMRKLYPAIMMVMACLLIIRGLGLGIPYLSPQFTMAASGTVHSCCHK